MHFGSTYTHGDAIADFPNLKVVAVGKLLTSSPISDYAQGNCLPEWVAVLGEVLKLDFDAAVTANFKDKLEPLVNFAIQLVNDGHAKASWSAG